MKKFTLHYYSYSYLLRQHKHRAAITVQQQDRIHFKTQLYNVIKGHTDQGYAGLWTTYATSDRDHQNENDNTIFDFILRIKTELIHTLLFLQNNVVLIQLRAIATRARNSTIYF
jgi:hypothetical protein